MVDETRGGELRAEQDEVEPGRPRVVTAAGLLLLMLPVVGVIGVVMAVIAVSAAQDASAALVVELAGQGVPDGQRLVDSLMSTMWLQLGGTAVVRLVQAIVLGLLAFFVLRGSRGARIAVFVLAGLSVLAVVCLGVLTGVLRELRGNLDRLGERAGFRTIDETDVLPDWFQPVNYALLAVSVVMILVAVWLLTRPAANVYFNRGRPARTPMPPPGVPPPGGLRPGGLLPGGPTTLDAAAPQQAGPVGEPQQAGPVGEPQQAGPVGEPQQAGPVGESQQAGPVGESQQAGLAAETQQATGTAPASTGLPPGFLRRASIVLIVLVAAVGSILALRGSDEVPRMPGAIPGAPLAASLPPDTPREVVYLVEIFGLTKSGTMTYSKAEGGSSTDHIPANLPAYSGTASFTRSRGVTVSLNASAIPPDTFPASALTPRLRCSIHVDGVVSATETGEGFCFITFALDEFTGVPVKPSRSPSPAPRVTVNTDCGYLTADQVADVVARVTGQTRRVPTVSGAFDGYCDYKFAKRGQYVQVSWTPGRELDPTSSERIIRVKDVPAIWSASDKGMQFELPSGTLWLQADMPVSDRIAQRIVTELLGIVQPKVS